MKKKQVFILSVVFMILSVLFVSTPYAAIQSDAVQYKGHSYAVVGTEKNSYERPTSFHEAKLECESLGGHLVTISSLKEEQVVYDIAKRAGANWYWIGLEKKDNNWSWIDSSSYSFKYWAKDAPSKKGRYGFIYGKKHTTKDKIKKVAGRWDSMNPYEPVHTEDDFYSVQYGGYICEWDYLEDKPQKYDSLSMEVGENTIIHSPDNNSNTITRWYSSDSNVVKVKTKEGTSTVVEAISEGTATVTAKYNGLSHRYKITVFEKQVEVCIGKKKYVSLAEAIKNVKSNETIKFLGNVKLSEAITLDKDFSYVVDLNGYKLTATKYKTPFEVENGEVTIKNGETTMNIEPIIGSKAKCKFKNMVCYMLTNEGKLTLSKSYIGSVYWASGLAGFTSNSGTTTAIDTTIHFLKAYGGKVVIKSGSLFPGESNPAIFVDKDGCVIVNNATISGGYGCITNQGRLEIKGGTIKRGVTPMYNSGMLIIRGGEFEEYSMSGWDFVNEGKIVMTGGTVKSKDKAVFTNGKNAKIFITGGKVIHSNKNGIATIYCPYGNNGGINVDEKCVSSMCEKIVYEPVIGENPLEQ